MGESLGGDVFGHAIGAAIFVKSPSDILICYGSLRAWKARNTSPPNHYPQGFDKIYNHAKAILYELPQTLWG